MQNGNQTVDLEIKIGCDHDYITMSLDNLDRITIPFSQTPCNIFKINLLSEQWVVFNILNPVGHAQVRPDDVGRQM